jgi:hypothetical protein
MRPWRTINSYNLKHIGNYKNHNNRLKHPSYSVFSKNLKKANINPAQCLEEVLKQGLGDGPFSKRNVAFAIFASLAIYGAAAASIASGSSYSEPVKEVKKEKDYSLKALAKEKPRLESKIFAPQEKPQEKILELRTYEDIFINDVEHFVAGQSHGVNSSMPALDIKSVDSNLDGVNWTLDISLDSDFDPEATYIVQLIAKDNSTFVAAKLGPSINKITYPDGTTELSKIQANDEHIVIPFNANKIMTSKFSDRLFIIKSQKGSTSDYFQDKLSNSVSEFERSLIDESNDVGDSTLKGNPPSWVYAKKDHFDILSAKREGNQIIVEFKKPPLTSSEDKLEYAAVYEIKSGNLSAYLGFVRWGQSTNGIQYDSKVIPGVLNVSGNKIIVPIPIPTSTDSNMGDSLRISTGYWCKDKESDPNVEFMARDDIMSGNTLTSATSRGGDMQVPPPLVFSKADVWRPTSPFEDTDVSNNHYNINSTFTWVQALKHIVEDSKYKYVEWWLYYPDNPVCLVAVDKKCLIPDHHTHDWEVIVDKYDKQSNEFIERATSFHVKVPSINPGWLFTNEKGPVYVEAGGHAMTPDPIIFKSPKTFTDPINNEKLFGIKGLGEDTLQLKISATSVFDINVVKSISDHYASETDQGQFKVQGYPPAANLLLGERALNPWHQTVYDYPGKIFESQLFQSDKQLAFLSVEVQGPVEVNIKIGDKILGASDGQIKTDFYGSYIQEGENKYLSALLDSYDVGQIEVKCKEDTEYKIKIQYLDVSRAKPYLLEKEEVQKISSSEKDIIHIEPKEGPIFERYRNAPNLAGIAAGAAAAILTAFGLGHYLKQRRSKKE